MKVHLRLPDWDFVRCGLTADPIAITDQPELVTCMICTAAVRLVEGRWEMRVFRRYYVPGEKNPPGWEWVPLPAPAKKGDGSNA